MKVLIACDKFKGSLDAAKVCSAIGLGIKEFNPSVIIKKLPLADGGDGTLDVLKDQLNFGIKHAGTTGPKGKPLMARYLSDSKTAYIELAEASGIRHLKKDEFDIFKASTAGTGMLMKQAIDEGHTDIVLSIGGSCTNDMGIGILGALGYMYKDANGQNLKPLAANLNDIYTIEKIAIVADFNLTILCDVNNPLYGSDGAAAVYGPQKGATPHDIKVLDNGMKQLSEIIAKDFDKDVSLLKGGGAAGGIAAGLFGVLDNVKITNGFDFIAEILGLDDAIKEADIVITGEGKFDSQSLQGKVVGHMIAYCQQYQKPLYLIAGTIDMPPEQLKSLSFAKMASVSSVASSFDDSIRNASAYLRQIGNSILR